MEESTRPDYVIPVGSVNGVWGMMKKLGQFRGEGWFALWKGPCSGHATLSRGLPQTSCFTLISYLGPVIIT